MAQHQQPFRNWSGKRQYSNGDAGVTFAQGPSSVYWNPAALAFVNKNETSFMLQPWILDINMMYFGASIYLNRIGTFALSITQMGYGDMDVTTMAQQDGTGENLPQMNLVQALPFLENSRIIFIWCDR